MQTVRNIALAGVAAVALAASAGLALAQSPAFHRLTVRLPDGQMAQIRYSGNVAPKVTFAPDPVAAGLYGPASLFATFDRISAEMDQQMDALMWQPVLLPAPVWPAEHMFRADLRNAPLGSAQYSVVSTRLGSGGYCMQSMQVTSAGNGARPKVVSHSYGNCGAMRGRPTLGSAPYVSPQHADHGTIHVNARPGERTPGPSLVEAAYRPLR